MDVGRSGIVLCVAPQRRSAGGGRPWSSLAWAATGGECQLQGCDLTRRSPILGELRLHLHRHPGSCQSNVAGAPNVGNVSGASTAGTVTLTAGQHDHGDGALQEPIPQGSGSCAAARRRVFPQHLADGKHTVSLQPRPARWPRWCCRHGRRQHDPHARPSSVPAGCTAPATYTISSDEPAFAAARGRSPRSPSARPPQTRTA